MTAGTVYHPKVHRQPYFIQFGAIIIGIAIFVAFKTYTPPWLYTLLPLLLVVFMVWYLYKDRHVTTANGAKKIRFGDIVFGCPECGSTKANKDVQ